MNPARNVFRQFARTSPLRALKGLATGLFVLSVFSACSLKSKDQKTIRVSFPKESQGTLDLTSGKKTGNASRALAADRALTEARSRDSLPRSLDGFQCFGLHVSGSGILPDPRLRCRDSSGNFGKIGGLAPTGDGAVEMLIPSGGGRTIQLFALKSTIGCPKMDEILDSPKDSRFDGLGEPILIGTAMADVFDDSSVAIKVTYDPKSATKIFKNCESSNDDQTQVYLEPTQIHFGEIAGAASGSYTGNFLSSRALTAEELDTVLANNEEDGPVSPTDAIRINASAGNRAALQLRWDVTDFDLARYANLGVWVQFGGGGTSSCAQSAGSSVRSWIYSSAAASWLGGYFWPDQFSGTNPSSSGFVSYYLRPQDLIVGQSDGRKYVILDLESTIVTAGSCASEIALMKAGLELRSYPFDQPTSAPSPFPSPSVTPSPAISPGPAPSATPSPSPSPSPTIQFALSSSVVNETSAASVQVAIQVSPPPRTSIDVPYSVSGTAANVRHSLPSSGVIHVSPQAGTVTLSFTVVDDSIRQTANETIVITLGAPSGTILGAQATHIVTLVNDDGDRITLDLGNLTVLTPSNVSSIAASGACSDPGQPVRVRVHASSDDSDHFFAASCGAGGAWSGTFDFSSVPDGNLTVTALHRQSGMTSEFSSPSMTILKDTTPPSPPTAVNDGNATPSLNQVPPLTWTNSVSSDVHHYEVSVTASDGSVALSWRALPPAISGGYTLADPINLAQGRRYFTSVRAVDPHGNTSSAASGDGWSVNAPLVAGTDHTCAITNDSYHSVKCWGDGAYGQLGNGAMTSTSSPVLVQINSTGPLQGAVGLALGTRHSCALRADGSVVCWGSNQLGQLGLGTISPTYIPQATTPVLTGPSSPLSDIRMISAGNDFTCALRNDGAVFCWGTNVSNQLGVTSSDVSPTSSSFSYYAVQVRSHSTDPSQKLIGVESISAGPTHSCVTTTSNGVKCWGANSSQQLGVSNGGSALFVPNPVSISGAVGVSTGAAFSCAVTQTGGVQCWGQNTYSELGVTGVSMSTSPVSVQLESGGALGGIVSVTSGYQHSCAQNAAGNVYCWGFAQYGQLGDGTASTQKLATPTRFSNSSMLDQVVRITSGANHSCAVSGDLSASSVTPSASCWGRNNSSQLQHSTSLATSPFAIGISF